MTWLDSSRTLPVVQLATAFDYDVRSWVGDLPSTVLVLMDGILDNGCMLNFGNPVHLCWTIQQQENNSILSSVIVAKSSERYHSKKEKTLQWGGLLWVMLCGCPCAFERCAHIDVWFTHDLTFRVDWYHYAPDSRSNLKIWFLSCL